MELRDYQADAIRRMKRGCILCGGTGSGKSITALAYYFLYCGGKIFSGDHMEKMTEPKDLFIITTAMKRDRHEWELELAPFLLSPDPKLSEYKTKVVIDSWNNIRKYKDVERSFFIFDEDRVTGSGAWVKSFQLIAKKNFWIILSATPGDKWEDYIPVFIANGFYRNKTDFMAHHAASMDRYYHVSSYMNEGLLLRHKKDILVDMDYIRPTKQHHEYISCSYDKDAYKKLLKTRWNPYKNEPVINMSELVGLMRRICNSDESRIAAALEIAEKHPKLIIFYNFDYELEALKNAGWYKGTAIGEWNGHRHDSLPRAARWVYLVQYNAGAEGWNCVTTDTILFFSQSYSYRSTIQAAGRIDRANTPFKDLWYYHLYSKSGIDLAIYRALQQKKEFNERRFVEGWKK